LAHGKPLDPDAALSKRIDQAEQAWAERELVVVRGDKWRETADWEHLRMAVDLAGRWKLRQTIPDLERAMAHFQMDMSGGSETPAPWNRIENTTWEFDQLRLGAQTALRRMGVRPPRLPATVLIQFEPKHRWIFPEKDEPPATPQAEALEKVRQQMTTADVMRLLGPPDYQGGTVERTRFRYDLDLPNPMSLVITLVGDRVGKIARYSPPLWQKELRCIGDWPNHDVFELIDPRLAEEP
jgi:hypothetical protein